MREDLGIPSDALVVLGCGLAEWRKGTDIFIRVARQVIRKMPKVHFIWLGVGDNIFSAELKAEKEHWDEGKQVHLVPQKLDSKPYFEAMDMFFLSSREDPFPLVMSESAVCKLPIVGFEGSGGVSELVESDAGFLAPYLNLAVMVEKIAILYDNPNLRKEMGENAYRKVNELYNETVLAPKVMQLIQSLIQQSSQSSVGV